MSQPSPYQSPQTTDSFRGKVPIPQCWYWYIAYCFFMVILYLAMCVLGYVFTIMDVPAEDVEMMKFQGIVFMVMSVPLALLFAIPPFLPKSKFAWIYGFVAIGIGLTSACCWPATIPLLIYWLKPELKAFLNVR